MWADCICLLPWTTFLFVYLEELSMIGCINNKHCRVAHKYIHSALGNCGIPFLECLFMPKPTDNWINMSGPHMSSRRWNTSRMCNTSQRCCKGTFSVQKIQKCPSDTSGGGHLEAQEVSGVSSAVGLVFYVFKMHGF